MGFDRDYDRLLGLAADLDNFQGYLNAEDKKHQVEAEAAYARERDEVVYAILAEKPDLDLVYMRIREDLAQVAADNPAWGPTSAFVAEDLIEHLTKEARKSPLQRKVVRYFLPALLVAAVIGYFGLWFYNDLSVDQPIETREGIEQRVAAYEKARRYDDWAGAQVRRGGWLKSILLKPFEPDDQEMEAATDFIGLSLNGLAALTEGGMACGAEGLLQADELNEAHLELVDDVAEKIRAKGVEWQEPPVMTVLPILQARFPCANPPEAQTEQSDPAP